MALSDRQRHEAYEALTDAFAERTDLVIEMLRPAHDLATTTDIDAVRRDLGQQVESLRREVGRQFAGVQNEFAGVQNEFVGVQNEFAGVRHEFAAVRHELAEMEARLSLSFERRINEAFAAQTRTLVLGLVGAFMLTALTNVLAVRLR